VTALVNALVAAGDDTIRAVQDLRELEPANSARRLNNRFWLDAAHIGYVPCYSPTGWFGWGS
jgi:hypothetical protein